ncbi:site-specific DNA-methyltransferase [Winogradskyella immobilis]|uniref:site-specific DNA-methyltransferase (adenine-specific) n=1 Tax=Winogradskyella immobilis TaxID=2816852 RepID=A0ABS8EM11_9FLAO|nr:site-specific DNA-methyltransferase [Winogradskyella immobilis]MCC1484248.1 site-specific DNA-methyltransferase [Winogradskyella immobilis]MCG0016340.1 site-specific DNA-methyltransferase [Winogradskyella immobilis]
MIKDIESKNEEVTICHKEIAFLKEHFPSCFKGDGSFDIERFKEEINEKVDITKEGYELKFLGKSYAKLLASLDTTTVITPNKEHNELPENKDSENIYISGDNLDGLKHLLKSYANAVKCIYIDPPYNTGSDGFVYNDSFNFTSEDLQHKLSVDEDEAQRILELTKSDSASHSAWLLFMYPRLQLAKDLLTDDGVIFISIDNNEQSNLKLLCDDIFGEENFIEMFLWNKTSTPPSLSTKSRKTNEYVLCYERYRSSFKYNGEKLDGGDQPLLNTGNSIKQLTFPKDKIYFNPKAFPDGVYKPYKPDRVSLINEIKITNGIPDKDVILEGPFKWNSSNLEDELNLGTSFIVKSEIISVRFINTKEGYKRPTNFIKDKIITPSINKKEQGVGTNENASSDLKSLFGFSPFSFSKPTSLIEYLINFNVEKDDFILDFFSGSASTANAVIELNSKDNGKRKVISVQLPENLEDSYLKATADNKKQLKQILEFLKSINRPSTLDYIGIERIIRASTKIKKESKADIDYGFKHYILNEPNQNTLDKCESFDKTALIADGSILDDFGANTVLTTWLNYDGYGLNAKYGELNLKGYTAYYCNKHLYLINPDFTQDTVMALFELYESKGDFNPENIILFGYSFNEWSVTEMLEKNLKILNDSDKNLKININVRY